MCRPSIQAAVSLARAARSIAAPPSLIEQLRIALAAHLDIDLHVALNMGTARATATTVAPATPSADSEPASGPETDDEAFSGSSLAYTPVRETEALLQAAPSSKSPPTTPPSGTDSGFSSTQGTPESIEAERAPSSPF